MHPSPTRPSTWTADRFNQLLRGYQPACIIAAAAELDLITLLDEQPADAHACARRAGADLRGITILLDALVALELLTRDDAAYRVPPDVAALLSARHPTNHLGMVRHQANCLRNWSQLAAVVQRGTPAERQPSIRGAAADYASFIEAMDNVARSMAADVVASLGPLTFSHLLDVGGASGSYTIAFLRAFPGVRATLFDLPPVMPQARQRLSDAGLLDRVTLAPGDFYTDPLPTGADLAWVSAIVHQNSRQQNRDLFARIAQALNPGGTILVRDFIMEESRAQPPAGALFAVNMLVNTPQGSTFTYHELREDLEAAGFRSVELRVRRDTMNSIMGGVRG